MKRILSSLAAIGAVTCSASAASIFLEFADPPGELSVAYTTAGPGEMFGTLAVDTAVDFEIDLTEFGMGAVEFVDAQFIHTVNIGQVVEPVPGTFVAQATSGMFEFLDSGGNLILSGAYGQGGTSGAVFVLSQSGGLTANASFVGGELSYMVGDFLQSVLDDNNQVLDFSSADAAWTLTGITPGVTVTDEGFFSSFDSNGSFSGTIATIPAPASVALLGLGGFAAARRRR